MPEEKQKKIADNSKSLKNPVKSEDAVVKENISIKDNTASKLTKEPDKETPILSIDSNNVLDEDIFKELQRYAESLGVALVKKVPTINKNNNSNLINGSDNSKNMSASHEEYIDYTKVFGSGLTENSADSENSKFRSLELKKLRLERQPTEKKLMIIKEISKVLTDIEGLKKAKKIIYFSHIENRKIYDLYNNKIGILKDLAISGGDRFPEVSHIFILHDKEKILIPWHYVQEFSKVIKLSKPFKELEKRELKDDDILLGVNILDQQVVDVNGLKVIRVNDIALTQIKNKLAVVNIDIGMRSMIRRLGFEKFFDMLHIAVKDHPVPWGSIEPLVGSIEKIHLKVPCPRVSDLHPADVAELFDELSMIERATILKSMKSETAAKVLLECEPDVQKAILKSLKLKRLAGIFEKMSANDVANILADFDNDRINLLINMMTKDHALKIQEMLSYKKDSVARYMSESFITISPELSVGTATDYVRSLSKYPTNFHYLYAVDENDMLVGVLSLKSLVVADANALIRNIMISKVISVDINYPIEYVEELISKYDLMALPVIDVNGKIRGIINIDEILNVVMQRNKNKEAFELSDEQKEDINRAKRIRESYSTIVTDVGQFIRDLESIKPKKKDYLIDNKGWFEKKQ